MNAVTMRLEEALGHIRSRLPGAIRDMRQATPAQIMVPRIVYATAATLLVLFGFLMIYSSSSIMALTSEVFNNNPGYFLVRQLAFALVGIAGCVFLAHVDYHMWRDRAIKIVWVATLVALLLTYTPLAGHDAYGATRWIGVGSITIQPAEFAKVEVVLMGARIAQAYFEDRAIDATDAAKLVALGVVLPLLLIVRQPDKGTCGVLLMTLIVMLYLSGVPGVVIACMGVVALAAGLAYAYLDVYSRARILTVLDPYRDEFGAGYQPIQGLLALGSGGLFGRGLGMSRQKYNYLPMAHNDFIFAIVGEELGFVGCAAMVCCFAVLLWAGLKVAELAPDLWGRLIAAGSTSLLIIQLLLNLAGVTGMFPLSGKPVPFVSYGGSSIISSLLLVGVTLSVSMCSTLPETTYERRRATLRLAKDEPESEAPARGGFVALRRPGLAAAAALDGHGASGTQTRSARLVRGTNLGARSVSANVSSNAGANAGVSPLRTSYTHLRLVEGGAASSRTPASASTPPERVSTPTSTSLPPQPVLGQTRKATRSNLGASFAGRDLSQAQSERARDARGQARRQDTQRREQRS